MRTKLPERSVVCFLLLYLGTIPRIPVPCVGEWSSRVDVHLIWLLIPTPALSAVFKSRCWEANVYLQCRISLCLSWDKFSHVPKSPQKTCVVTLGVVIQQQATKVSFQPKLAVHGPCSWKAGKPSDNISLPCPNYPWVIPCGVGFFYTLQDA